MNLSNNFLFIYLCFFFYFAVWNMIDKMNSWSQIIWFLMKLLTNLENKSMALMIDIVLFRKTDLYAKYAGQQLPKYCS